MTSSKARLAAVVLVCASAAACRRPHRPDSDGHPWIRTPFRVHAGDDPAWADPAFDDSAWQQLDSSLRGSAIPEGWAGIGWFRGWIDVAPEQTGKPLALYGRYAGAAEVFIDGTRRFSIGDPAAVAATGTTPIDVSALEPQWVTFDTPGRHLFAVRFASQHIEALHRVGFPGGFELSLKPPSADDRAARTVGWVAHTTFIGAAAALALLHLFLYAFHRNRRENLFYALTAVGVATITVTNESLRTASTATEAIFLIAAATSAIALSTVLLLRFYHAVFSPRLPATWWVFFGVAWLLVATSWLLPRSYVYVFAIAVAVAQFRVLLGAVLRRASGAWIIAIGGALWLVGASLQMLSDAGVMPWLDSPYLWGFLALLVSMSVYLARDVRALSDKYRTVFQTTGTGTILFSDGGAAVISLANDEWAKLTGYTREEIEGRMSWASFFPDTALPETAGTREAKLKDRRGRVRDGVVTVSQVPGTRDRVGSFLDLTDLKRAQRQMFRADKMAALGQLIAGVAHEINNPNNFIHFNLPVLRRYVDAMRPLLELQLEKDPELKLLNMKYQAFIDDLFKLLDNMEHGSTRITAIVSDLKSYIRSGEDLEMAPGSIAKVVERVTALVGNQVGKLVKRFDVDVAQGLPPVRMNAGKLEQVLINLVVNAGQAADKDDAWVKLSARLAEAKDAVELRVEDNGSGITAENLEHVFEPFFTTKGRESGTGLGLSISQQIVEEHGGRIDVTSEPGRGSCFTVRLPI